MHTHIDLARKELVRKVMAEMVRSMNANEALSLDVFTSLKEVSKGMLQRRILPTHKVWLIQRGYIKEGGGGLALTFKGKVRVSCPQELR